MCVDDEHQLPFGILKAGRLYRIAQVLNNDCTLEGTICNWKIGRFRRATADEITAEQMREIGRQTAQEPTQIAIQLSRC